MRRTGSAACGACGWRTAPSPTPTVRVRVRVRARAEARVRVRVRPVRVRIRVRVLKLTLTLFRRGGHGRWARVRLGWQPMGGWHRRRA